MKVPGVYIVLFFLLSSLYAVPQNQNFLFKAININDGLSQNSVVDIIEDPTGFMWFATQDGLNRYDGRNFLVFPLGFDNVTSPENAQLGKLLVHDDKIYMIIKGGKIEVLDLFTHKLNSFSTAGPKNTKLPSASYLFIDNREGLWIGTFNKGLYYLDKNNNLHRFTTASDSPKGILSNRIRSVFQDSKERIWILTNKGVTRFSEETSENQLAGINTHVLTEARDGALWLGTLGNGIYYMEPGSGNFLPFAGYKNYPLPHDLVVECIYTDTTGRIWVGTYGNGLYLIDSSLKEISHFTPDRNNPSALSFQDVLSITEDRNGGIWVGTDGGGINYYNSQLNHFKRVTAHDVEPGISIEQIRAITTDNQEKVWLGTSGQGITSFDPLLQDFQTFHLKPFKPGVRNYDRVVSLQTDCDDDLWIGTHGNGLLIMNKGSGEIKKWFTTEVEEENQRIPDNTIWAMVSEKENQKWVASRHAGLLLLDKEQGLLETCMMNSEGSTTADKNLQALIRIDTTTLALGFEKKGIHLYDTTTGEFTAVTNPVIDNVLKDETGIKSLFYEEEWLWIGTAGRGVIVTNLKTGTTQVLNDEGWLPNNMIYSIMPENKGRIWMSSNKGLFRLVYTYGPEQVNILQIFPFTVDHGLQSNEFNTGASHRAPNGTLYFGGISGLNYFHPKDISYNRQNLHVVLTQGMVGNKPLQTDTVITYKNHLQLSYRENSISFNYTLQDYISPENLHYQYKLEGHDENWVQAGNRNYVAYTNLPPDDYTFKVKVSDKISEKAPVTSLGISIAAPFWMQWWFLILIAILAAGFVYSLHRYRIYQLMEVQKVKNNISADLHDDLGARLTNIHFLHAIFKQKLNSGEKDLKYLEEIEEEVEASAKSLDEIVWNINMKDENLEEIVAKMRKYATEVLETTYDYHIKIDGNFRKKKMSMQKRRELFLTFKELINNVRKHAEATEVNINISIEDKMFFMKIQDNGCGFDPEKKTQRHGLKNIRERIRKWDGEIFIKSGNFKGSEITLKIPFDRWYRLL